MNTLIRKVNRWILVVLFGISLAAQAKDEAASETMIPFTIQQLSTASTWVVHGIVEETTTCRDESRRIFTEITVVVIEGWKGNLASGKLKFVQGGGSLGNERVEVSGQPQFGPGEEVVLFLVKNKRGEAVIYAMGQGKFEVHQENGIKKVVKNPFHGFSANQNAKALNAKSLQNTNASLTLESLKNQVRGSLSHSK